VAPRLLSAWERKVDVVFLGHLALPLFCLLISSLMMPNELQSLGSVYLGLDPLPRLGPQPSHPVPSP
jgi:hypothetical protein